MRIPYTTDLNSIVEAAVVGVFLLACFALLLVGLCHGTRSLVGKGRKLTPVYAVAITALAIVALAISVYFGTHS